MTFIALTPSIYTNAAQYGASPGNTAAQNDAAFAAGIAVVTAAGGGCMFIPAGTYACSGLSLTSLSDVSVLGTGTGTVLAPSSGATGITYSGCTRCHLGNLRIDGSLHGAATGISIAGNFDAKLYNLHVNGCSGDGVYVNGDNASGTEIEISDLTCRDNGGWGYHYQRTNTTDHGGMYLTNYRALYNTQGTGGIKIESSVAATPMFHTFIDTVCDNYTGIAVSLHNTVHVRFTALWAASSGAEAVLIDGTGSLVQINGAYLFNSNASGYDLAIANAVDHVVLDNVHFDGACLANIHVTGTGADYFLGQYISVGGVQLTDTPGALFTRSTNVVKSGPTVFATNGAGGFSTSLALDDTNNANKQKYLRNNNGVLQVLNTAFSATIFQLFDQGDLQINGFLATGQSASAAVTTSSGTIATVDIGVSRVAPTGNVTGVILSPGVMNGQLVTVINESSFSLTFAASGTSFVADGVSDVIVATTARSFVWDGGTSLWYRTG